MRKNNTVLNNGMQKFFKRTCSLLLENVNLTYQGNFVNSRHDRKNTQSHFFPTALFCATALNTHPWFPVHKTMCKIGGGEDVSNMVDNHQKTNLPQLHNHIIFHSIKGLGGSNVHKKRMPKIMLQLVYVR